MTGAGRQGLQEEDRKELMKPAITGAILLAVAVVVATVIMLMTAIPRRAASEQAESAPEVPKVTYIPARPSTEPTADPIINSLKLMAFGSEITADGFTAYVGDKAITLTVELEPRYTHPPVNWSVSSSEAARIVVSDDRMSCEFTPLKSSGKIELTVSCYGAAAVFPVYVWER